VHVLLLDIIGKLPNGRLEVVSKPHLPAQWSGISHLIERRFKELKRLNGCVAPLAGFASDFFDKGAVNPRINAYPPQAHGAFSVGLRLDAYSNLLRSDM
jgi:hypothetical protein